MLNTPPSTAKPLLRGYFHQVAFFLSLIACAMLVSKCNRAPEIVGTLIYSLSLVGLFGVSALYHRPQWGIRARKWMRRIDHAMIFFLIAGTGTPLCLLALPDSSGTRLLWLLWAAAGAGVLQSLLWVHAPKWLSALLYVSVGWLGLPYVSEFEASLSLSSRNLLLAGGIVYTVGALVYALKQPNPSPRVFGYHEIFHILVIVAAGCHFAVIYRLVV